MSNLPQPVDTPAENDSANKPRRGAAVDPLVVIRDMIGAAYKDARRLQEAGDWEGLLLGLATLDILRRDIATLRDAVGEMAAPLMPEKAIPIEGVGLFTRRATSKRTTDWDTLLGEIRGRALVTDDGEIVEDPVEAVDAALALIRSIVPLYRSTAAKQGGLSDAGIDRETVQDDEWKAPNVSFKGVDQ